MRYICIPGAGLSYGRAFLCFAALLLFAGQVNAQLAGTGNIQGTVSDPSGAVIPLAQITVTDQATGVKHQTVSSGGGPSAPDSRSGAFLRP